MVSDGDGLFAEKCELFLEKIARLKRKLILGNKSFERMTFEEIRIAKAYYFVVD